MPNDRGTSLVVLRCNADSRLGRCDPGAFPPRSQSCSDTRISTSAVDTHPDRTVHRAIHVKLPKNSLTLPLIAALFVPICRNFRPPLRKNVEGKLVRPLQHFTSTNSYRVRSVGVLAFPRMYPAAATPERNAPSTLPPASQSPHTAILVVGSKRAARLSFCGVALNRHRCASR